MPADLEGLTHRQTERVTNFTMIAFVLVAKGVATMDSAYDHREKLWDMAESLEKLWQAERGKEEHPAFQTILDQYVTAQLVAARMEGRAWYNEPVTYHDAAPSC